jgi:hypothetical protein
VQYEIENDGITLPTGYVRDAPARLGQETYPQQNVALEFQTNIGTNHYYE